MKEDGNIATYFQYVDEITNTLEGLESQLMRRLLYEGFLEHYQGDSTQSYWS